MTQSRRPCYCSYLLRCWAEVDAQGEVNLWRFSLEDPRTGRRHGFASLTALVIALQDELMGEKTGNREQEVEGRGDCDEMTPTSYE